MLETNLFIHKFFPNLPSRSCSFSNFYFRQISWFYSQFCHKILLNFLSALISNSRPPFTISFTQPDLREWNFIIILFWQGAWQFLTLSPSLTTSRPLDDHLVTTGRPVCSLKVYFFQSVFLKCIFPKCMYPKCIFAKCTRLACLLSFASLLQQ